MFATLRLATARTTSAAPIKAASGIASSSVSSSDGLIPWLRPELLDAESSSARLSAGLAGRRFAERVRSAALADSSVSSGSKPADDHEGQASHGPITSSAAPSGIQKSGPAIRTGPDEPLWRDADDGERLGVHEQGAAQDIRVPAHPLPRGVAQHENRGAAAWSFFIGREGPSDREPGAEHVEVRPRHERGLDATRLAFVGHADVNRLVSERLSEELRPVANRLVFPVRERTIGIGPGGVVYVDADDGPRLIRSGRRLEQEQVDQAEHRAVRADAEGEHHDGRQGERRRLREQPHAVAHVARDRVEPRGRPRRTDRFLHLVDAAHLEARLAPGLFGAHARRDLLVHEHVEVAGHLPVEVAPRGIATGELGEAGRGLEAESA